MKQTDRLLENEILGTIEAHFYVFEHGLSNNLASLTMVFCMKIKKFSQNWGNQHALFSRKSIHYQERLGL